MKELSLLISGTPAPPAQGIEHEKPQKMDDEYTEKEIHKKQTQGGGPGKRYSKREVIQRPGQRLAAIQPVASSGEQSRLGAE